MSFLLKMLMASGDATTWSPTDKAADVSLFNDNLTAQRTANTGGSHVCVRSTTSRSTGKWYFEIARDQTNSDQINIGLVTGAFVLAGSFQFPGSNQSGAGLGYLENVFGGAIQLAGGSPIATLGAASTAGDIAGFAVDLDNKRVWVRLNGGDWLADPSANPSTNTGGVDISTALPGAVFICADVAAVSGCGAVLNTGGQSFGFAQPSGFIAWN